MVASSYDGIKTQNITMNNYIQQANDTYSMYQTQFQVKTLQYPNLGYIYNSFFIGYWSIWFVGLLILGISTKLSWYMKVLILVLFLIYPFFIFAIENALYQIVYFIYSVIWGESYDKIWSTENIFTGQEIVHNNT